MTACSKCGELKPAEDFARHRRQCRECRGAYLKAWHEANPEKVRERKRAYAEANREKFREWNRAYREANPGARSEYFREYRKANRDKGAEYCARRRARIAGAPVVEKIDRAAIIERDKSRCHICRKKCKASEIQLDHLVPLARGGEHSARNIAVACASCNWSKNARAANDQLRLVG